MQGGVDEDTARQALYAVGGTVSAGLICFDVNGMQPKAVVKRLLQHKIVASTTPYGISYARLAPSLVNTPKEARIRDTPE